MCGVSNASNDLIGYNRCVKRIAEPTSRPFTDTVLELRDVQLVMAIAQSGTTKAAGEALHLAQPSVSRALLSLEDRLGAVLFHRTPRGLVATHAGNVLREHGAELLERARQVEQLVRAPRPKVERIRIVSECHTAYHWLPTTLEALRLHVPDVRLTLELQHSRRAIEAIGNGDVDAALVTSPLRPTDNVDVAPLFQDELIFVVAPNHPLAKRRHLTAKDFANHTLYTVKPTRAEAERFVRSVFGRRKPNMHVTFIDLSEAVACFARAGMGIGLLTEWVAKDYLGDGTLIPKRLKQPLHRQWSLAWQRSLGDVGVQLGEALKRSRGKT